MTLPGPPMAAGIRFLHQPASDWTIFRRIQKTAWQPAEPRYRSLIRIIGYGVLAQLVEHHNGIVGVSGSSPLCSTTFPQGIVCGQ
jgi:hypothetical protein